MKILILKPSSLGDVVQAIPVLRLIKRHLPAAQIYWWIETGLAPLLEGDPDLAGVVRFDRRRWATPANWNQLWRDVQWLRAQRFDWVIDLQCLLRSGAFAWIADGDFLIGLDEKREGARGFYDVAVPRASYHTHAVDWYLSVLPRLGVPVHWNFDWLPHSPAIAAAVREKWKPDTDLWIALQPGARWTNKRWPATHFAELIRLLSSRYDDARFAILGGSDDIALADSIVSAAPERCLNLAGRTSLLEMVEWLRLSRLLVTNDTGPMHVAAALRMPVVATLGPTDERRTGPYGQLDRVVRHPLPCAPCMKSRCHYSLPMECLNAISPAEVFARVERLLPTR
ncbi:MAG TPA: lipopolysaccharide heptosyltransferase II [Verrucomicrobiota bacterium]|nr:lipopolysaccharide heptosyltransferase II [Verrucomicrobiota bacterium]